MSAIVDPDRDISVNAIEIPLRIATRTCATSGIGIPSYSRRPFLLPLSTGKRRPERIYRRTLFDSVGLNDINQYNPALRAA